MVTKTRPKAVAHKATGKKATGNFKTSGPKPIVGLLGLGLLQRGKESRLELRDQLRMPRGLFGRIVNVSERTIAKVEATAQGANKLRRSYNEVFRLVMALSEIIDPAELSEWFITPNDAFDGLKPLEVIERGDSHRLWDMCFRLHSGMPG